MGVQSGLRTHLLECGVILDHAPALANHVARGLIPLHQAYRQADAARRAAHRLTPHPIDDVTTDEALEKQWEEHYRKGRELEAATTAAAAHAGRYASQPAHKDKPGTINHRYVNIAKAVFVAAEIGRTDAGFGDYDPADLDPPELARYLELDELADALRGIQKLIRWRQRQPDSLEGTA